MNYGSHFKFQSLSFPFTEYFFKTLLMPSSRKLDDLISFGELGSEARLMNIRGPRMSTNLALEVIKPDRTLKDRFG